MTPGHALAKIPGRRDDNWSALNSHPINLAFDHNGNLADDGVLQYGHDAWDRLTNTKLAASGDGTAIATYGYYGHNRRSQKVVTNRGPEVGDGGSMTVRFAHVRAALLPNVPDARRSRFVCRSRLLWHDHDPQLFPPI